ncbi:LPXTG-motif cell wall anchor domain-containing protein [Pilibacter termitis]|uniref:LPXTG-motif cell wall anchor domain-containing protein n=1 Tax=Pilibacter termitis TaxID=263852 RepID=A0A1T4NDV3_9ENTE|nr:SpaA isopeptide-forming pilin-related protein [Pilibacter termitis]SJZ77521.1 LPXTG-motif cell wall anchor domain-containing protein [Pilibacter termitis]
MIKQLKNLFKKTKQYQKKQKLSSWLSLLTTIGGVFFSSLSPIMAHAVTSTVDGTDSTGIYLNVQGGLSGGDLIIRYKINGRVAYCIEPSVPSYHGGNAYSEQPKPTQEKINMIGLVAETLYNAEVDNDSFAAAQWLIWEEVVGASTISYMFGGDYNRIIDYKTKIANEVNQRLKLPSFNGQTITVKMGQPVTLTDMNNRVADYNVLVSNPNKLKYSVNGDKLVLTADSSSIQGDSSFSLGWRELNISSLVWKTDDGLGNPAQTMFSIGDPFKNTFSLNVRVIKTGNLKIRKVDKQSGAVVPNTKFKVEGNFADGTKSKEVTTDSNGEAILSDVADDGENLKVTEIYVPSPYVLDSTPQTATIKAGETVTITKQNDRQKGRIQLNKELLANVVQDGGGKQLPNGKYSFKGIQFDIFNNAQATGTPLETLTLDDKGVSNLSQYYELGDYYVKEKPVSSSTGQLTNGNIYHIVLNYKGQTVADFIESKTVENKAVHGEITFDKSLEKYGKVLPNGHYNLSGIEFLLTNIENKKQYTIQTDKNGIAKTPSDMPLGEYDVKEVANSVTSATGQTVNTTTFRATLKWVDDHTELVLHDTKVMNKIVTGQITVKKQGLESGLNLWNSHYSLAGNVFDVVSTDGKYKETITTNAQGLAKTSTELPLGDYDITEIKASNGFVNTFKKQRVTLTWKDNKTEIVYAEGTGTNQEVTGQVTLTKTDSELGKTETQGLATFKGAEFGLYYDEDIYTHKQGDKVKWTENFSPKLLKGTKVKTSDDTIVIEVDDKAQLGLEHLAVGKYYLQETKSPEGYAIETRKIPFEIKKTNDDPKNAVDVQTVTSKEQVIKFNLEFFKKFVENSSIGGLNGVTLKATPINNTKGKEQLVTTGTFTNGNLHYDGYGQFKGLVYGDWEITEVSAPSGYAKIDPHVITMRQKNDNYVFTLMKKGNTNPAKTVTVPIKDLTDKATSSFVVDMYDVTFLDNAIQKPNYELSTHAFWASNEKTTLPFGVQKAYDEVSYSLSERKDWFLVTKVLDLGKIDQEQDTARDLNASPVLLEVSSSVKNVAYEGTWKIPTTINTQDLAGHDVVFFQYLYNSEEEYKAKKAPVATHTDVNSTEQTLTILPKQEPKLESKATVNGKQFFIGNKETSFLDELEIKELQDFSSYSLDVLLTRIEGKQSTIVYKNTVDFKTQNNKEYLTKQKTTLDTSKDKPNVEYSWSYYLYQVEGGTRYLLSAHNVNNEEESQKVKVVKGNITIQTKAHDKNGNTTFKVGDIVDMFDDIEITTENYTKEDGLRYQTSLIAVMKNGSTKVVAQTEKKVIDVETDKFVTQELIKQVDTSKYPNVDYFTFVEEVTDKDNTVVQTHNDDFKVKEQSLFPVVTPKAELPKTALPKTGENNTTIFTIFGAMTLLSVGGFFFYRKKKNAK